MAKDKDPLSGPQWEKWIAENRRLKAAFERSGMTEWHRQFKALPESHPLKVHLRNLQETQERKQRRELEREILAEIRKRGEQERQQGEERRARGGRKRIEITLWDQAINDLNQALARQPAGSLLHRQRTARRKHMINFLHGQPGFKPPPEHRVAPELFKRLVLDRLAEAEEAGIIKP